MGNDEKKTELAPTTLETLILKTIERNAVPMRGYGIALHQADLQRRAAE
jgi:hypothetical protein